jgi:hypothetical protein
MLEGIETQIGQVRRLSVTINPEDTAFFLPRSGHSILTLYIRNKIAFIKLKCKKSKAKCISYHSTGTEEINDICSIVVENSREKPLNHWRLKDL